MSVIRDQLRPVDRLDQIALPERIAESVVSRIAVGDLVSGERLHEAALAASLGVSRMPVREALWILDAQGILVSAPQRGHRVVTVGPDWVSECYKVRGAMEHAVTARAAAKLRDTPGLDQGLHAILREMRLHMELQNVLEYHRAALAFHTEIYRLSGLGTLASLWRGIRRHFLIIFVRKLGAHGARPIADAFREHLSLLDALTKLNDRELACEISYYLGFSKLRDGASVHNP
jgi:DNA-binding GntR family transcriptional regulator